MPEYVTQFQEVAMSANWCIELPVEWFASVDPSGVTPYVEGDDRTSKRSMTQTPAVMWFEKSHLPRSPRPIGIYTRDVSDCGASFLAPFQIFDHEEVRVALLDGWMQLQVVRSVKVTSHCYEIGARILQRHDPDCAAFSLSCSAVTAG